MSNTLVPHQKKAHSSENVSILHRTRLEQESTVCDTYAGGEFGFRFDESLKGAGRGGDDGGIPKGAVAAGAAYPIYNDTHSTLINQAST